MQFDEDILELEEREEREAFSVRNSKTVCYWNANFNKVSHRLLLVRAFKMFISCIQTYMHTYITFMYSGTPPYDHLVITTTFFCPGETPIHFLIRKPR